MKVMDVIKLVESDGWRHVVTKGSHRQSNIRTSPGALQSRDIQETICILVR
jgi:predicted RNA binding protein YcfA (HicA-like mRNA interferase family)